MGAGEAEAAEARDEARRAAARPRWTPTPEVDEERGADADADGDADAGADGPPEHSRKVRAAGARGPASQDDRDEAADPRGAAHRRAAVPAGRHPAPETREPSAASEARPCPWVACKHHLYLDVNPETGSIKINFPDLEPWELPDTCALDVAERGGITLEEVGEIMNLTRERIRQVEVRGLLKLKMGRRRRTSSAPSCCGPAADDRD